MNTLLAPPDTIAESQRIIALIEHLHEELPFADELLAIHSPTQRELEQTHTRSAQAVAAWQAALASRWEHEVAGRRLYKRMLRRLIEHHGSEQAPEVQLLSRGGAEANSSPAELLADLRRLHAASVIGAPIFSRELQAELVASCSGLAAAIASATSCETERRTAVIDHRLACEAYRRARAETQRRLREYYGVRADEMLDAVFGE